MGKVIEEITETIDFDVMVKEQFIDDIAFNLFFELYENKKNIYPDPKLAAKFAAEEAYMAANELWNQKQKQNTENE